MTFFLGLIGVILVVLTVAFLIDTARLKGGWKNITKKDLIKLLTFYLLFFAMAAFGFLVRAVFLMVTGKLQT